MKRCIFCKIDSSFSMSVEHIIPESLGNKEHILPQGIVCDKCNNYFASKIEKPLLESEAFIHIRFRNNIPNKRGKIPSIEGVIYSNGIRVFIDNAVETRSIRAVDEKDEPILINDILNKEKGILVIKIPEYPENSLLSRFIGKIALEALAKKLLDNALGLDEIIDHSDLDELRYFIRFGVKGKVWPIYQRQIYREEDVFYEDGYGRYELLHEYIFLYTEKRELYFVLILFGREYVINLGCPSIDGYEEWLALNDNVSPLYKDLW